MKQPLLALITSLVSIAGGAYLFTNALENVQNEYSTVRYDHSAVSVTYIPSDRPGVGFDRSGIPSDRPAASAGVSSGWSDGGGSGTQSGLPTMSADASGNASDYLFSPRTAGGQTAAPADSYATGASYGSRYAYTYTGKSSNRTTNTPGTGMTGYLALPASGAATSRGGGGNGASGSNGSVSGGASTYAGLRSLSAIHTDGTVSGPFAVGDGIIDPDNDGEDAPPPPPLPIGEGMSILIALGLGYVLWKRLKLR